MICSVQTLHQCIQAHFLLVATANIWINTEIEFGQQTTAATLPTKNGKKLNTPFSHYITLVHVHIFGLNSQANSSSRTRER